jgi:hypothetical protein
MSSVVFSKWIAIVGTSLLSAACGFSHTQSSETPDRQVAKSKVAKKAKKAKKSSGVVKNALQVRKVGDYFVHRFSGSYRQEPLTLTERVVADEDEHLVIDYSLSEGEASFTLRARLEKRTGNVVEVSELDGEKEVAVPLSAYDELMAKTSFAPDVNDKLLAEEAQTCLVGPEELDCETKNYRVFVGDEEAVLSVTRSADLPGRDIAGEVTAVDGSIIYRAELMEAGNERPMPTVAELPEEYRD